MDALLAAAKSVNEPGLVQHVEKLQRRLSRLTVGASTSLEEVGAPLAQQAEDRRLRRSEHARTVHFDALVAQQRIKTKVQRARKAVKTQARIRARALKCALADIDETLKDFDAGDLGAGEVGGGSDKHYRARLDLLQRVVGRFPDVPAELVVNLKRDHGWWDRSRRSTHARDWGLKFLKEMKLLLTKEVDCATYLREQRDFFSPAPAISA